MNWPRNHAFVEELQRLREWFDKKRNSTNYFTLPNRDTHMSFVDGIVYVTHWIEGQSPDDDVWVLRLADIPGTLSGDILRCERDVPTLYTSYEIVGDAIHALDTPPPPPYYADDAQDVSEVLASLPLVEVDPKIHFVKKPNYISEVFNNLTCLGGTCPGAPKSPYIVPLLGRSTNGELVFESFAHHYVLYQAAYPLSTYKTWILQLIDGLRCLHSLGIVHRDIGIFNLVWSVDHSRVLICDLEGRWGRQDAPEFHELAVLSAGWTVKSDIYALGSAIVSMLYACEGVSLQFKRPVPAPLADVVEACTRPSPNDRPTLDELYDMVENIACD
ncbi:hypothetical protein AURDEDRAFT_136179 [Auricularia subglabra TFB-10046 SS5]|nr:hypothetical protein AURDEDRAFT_136179 [Auricularia subglabra TFB-10046 SS5]